MSLISFGEINKNILYPIIGGLSKLIAEFILFKKQPLFTEYPFILGIIAGFGMFLSIIPFIILKIQSRRANAEKRTKSKKLIYNNRNDVFKKKMCCIKYLLILSVSLFDFSQKILTFLFISEIINNFWVLDIFLITVFSLIILRTKLYSYQLCSLGAIILLGIIFNIVNLFDSGEFKLTSFILIMSIKIIYSLEIVIEKYIMEYKFCSPYEICIFEGLFEIIANIILLIILHNIGMEEDSFFDYIKELKNEESIKEEIILLIISMISGLFFKLFSLITINFYTSSHVVIILILGEIMLIFTNKKRENDNLYEIKIICNIFLIIFVIFMTFVFTEFIELNFCGLQKNTKRNIEKRALTEVSISSENNKEINNDFRDSSLEPINDEIENEIPTQKEI